MTPSAAVNFEFSDDQELLRDTIRRYFEDQASVTSHVRSMLDDERGLDDAVWKALADLGALGLLVPTDTGAANDLIAAGVVLEEAGRALLPEPLIASSIGAVTAIAASAVRDEQDLLDGIADGSRIATVALHEPGHRYAWRSPSTTATRVADEWRLSGAKSPVLGATTADTFVVSALAEGGCGLFLVAFDDLDDRAVTPEKSIDNSRKLGRLLLNNTRARRIGPTDASEIVARVVDVVAVALALDAVGAAAAVLELAVAYGRERKQFGVPIGSFQAVQHLCADMLRDVEIARAGAYYALWACQSADDVERHRAAVMAKAYASDALPKVGESAIQVFGGIGFTWEHDVHLYYKRMLSAAALFGNAESQYDELARLVID